MKQNLIRPVGPSRVCLSNRLFTRGRSRMIPFWGTPKRHKEDRFSVFFFLLFFPFFFFLFFWGGGGCAKWTCKRDNCPLHRGANIFIGRRVLSS